MKRVIWFAVLIALATLVGCSSGEPEGPETVPVSSGDDPFQTATFAGARAEWEQLAELGDPEAQRKLGLAYYLGQGIDPNYAVALDWFNKAAAQGEDIAQMTLGVMHVEGQGVERDNVRAHMWLSLSAQAGNPNALIRLEELAATMSEEDVAAAQKLAQEWTPAG